MSLSLAHKASRRVAFGIGLSFAITVYLLLMVLDALPVLSRPLSRIQVQAFGFQWGFSILVALTFLIIGMLVWRYSQEDLIGFLFLGFCLALMSLFLIFPAASASIAPFTALSSVLTTLALLFLLALSFSFPYRFLRWWWMRVYFFLVLGFSLIMIALYLRSWGQATLTAEWHLVASYYSVILLSIVVALVAAYFRRDASLRKQQQLRLFTGGLLISISPLLLLTVLPGAFHLPDHFIVSGQFSGLAICLLPLFLGYAIVRYQLLIRDVYLQRIALWIVRMTGMLCGGYLIFLLVSLVASPAVAVTLAAVGTLLEAIAVWQASPALIEWLFFPEYHYYRQLVERRGLFSPSKQDRLLLELSSTLTILFQTRRVQLYVLDEIADGYRQQDVRLDQHSFQETAFDSEPLIAADHPLIAILSQANIPLVLDSDQRPLAGPVGFPLDEQQILIVPFRGESLLGFAVIGQRGDGEQYAGSDFEALAFLQQHVVPRLFAMLADRRRSRLALIQGLLYASFSHPPHPQNMQAIVQMYARVAVRAFGPCTVDIWLPDCRFAHPQPLFKRVITVGESPFSDRFLAHAQVQQSSFYADHHQQEILRRILSFVLNTASSDTCRSVAWLPFPLLSEEAELGILAITWPDPHCFPEEERQVLDLFRSCLAAACQTRTLTHRLARTDREGEQANSLKNDFISMASQEWRTLLTMIHGYRELLELPDLTPEQRAIFTQKAVTASEELSLVLGNIADAGQLSTTMAQVQMQALHLPEQVQRVVEIFHMRAQREQRTFQVDVPDVWVCADGARLRQVLFNLLTNAFNYSAHGLPIECGGTFQGEDVTFHIRDYGPGIPPDEQCSLFERFSSLERDMHDPVRGAGLGLFICRQIIEAMDGHLWVESSGVEGEGSLFSFSLSVAIAPALALSYQSGES